MEEDSDVWKLRLYIAGSTPGLEAAADNIRKVCDEYLNGQYDFEVIDIVDRPQLARDEKIVAVPTLMRRLPSPIRQVIGNLSERERVIVGLDLINSRKLKI